MSFARLHESLHMHTHTLHMCVSAGQVCFEGEMSVFGEEVFLQPAASPPLLCGRRPIPWRTAGFSLAQQMTRVRVRARLHICSSGHV